MQIENRLIEANGTELSVNIAGDGPAVLLLHGWPHTWQVWRPVLDELAQAHRVIAPDLRGLGASRHEPAAYDLNTLAADAEALLDALDEPNAAVVGIDAGGPVAFQLALTRPERVSAAIIAECVLPGLPGAEDFLAAGPPWWFGFHGVPGLAETVVAGHEAAYLDFFLTSGTWQGRGIDPAIRAEFIAAYSGADALRCGFEYYRAMPTNGRQVAESVAAKRLTVPTLAVGAGAVGTATAEQLRPIADDLTEEFIDECGHLIPLDRPAALLDRLIPFLSRAETAPRTIAVS